MDDFAAPDCKIFVDAEMSETELAGVIAQLLFPPGDEVLGCEADIVRSEDYDSNRRKQFPGGFVYFRYYIDLYLDDPDRPDKAALVARVLEGLWSWGLPAVAACGYEDQLPHNGGYKSRAVPFPR